LSRFLLDFLREVNSWLVLCEVYGCTVVQDQCTVVALYYYITSLPVYPNTVHGHCTTVVLDTSNIVYCIATLMECTVQCSALASLIGQYAFFIWSKASYVYALIYNTTLNANCTISIGMSNPIRSRTWGGQFGD
jgi:hypothetical protein